MPRQQSRYNQSSPPEGYRNAEAVFESPVGKIVAKCFVPSAELYPAEVTRLSRKATRSFPYSAPVWNDELRAMLKVREVTESFAVPGGTAHKTIRELHDAAKPAEDSLLQVHFITMNDLGMSIDDEAIYPTEYISYTPATDFLERYYINTYSESMGQSGLEQAIDLLRATGETRAAERERIVFYSGLVYAAGESMR